MLDTQKLGATLNGKTLGLLLAQGEGLMPRKDASTPAQPFSLTYNGDRRQIKQKDMEATESLSLWRESFICFDSTQ